MNAQKYDESLLLGNEDTPMNIEQALELAEKSIEGFEEKIYKIKLKHLYELASNLRFIDKGNITVFQVAYDILKRRLVEWYKYMEYSQKKRKDIDKFYYSERLTAYDLTGFEFFHYESREFDSRPPSQIFKEFIDKISGWEK